MICEPIKYYLESNGVQNIFISFSPTSPDDAIILYLTPGRSPDAKHQYDSPSFQVKVRGLDYHETETRAYNIFSYLQSLSTVSISGIHFVDIQALQTPFLLQYDAMNRPEFVQNFITEVYHETINRER